MHFICIRTFPHNIPKGFAGRIKLVRPTRVNMMVEGYIHKAANVFIKNHEDTLQLTIGWHTFVGENAFYNYN